MGSFYFLWTWRGRCRPQFLEPPVLAGCLISPTSSREESSLRTQGLARKDPKWWIPRPPSPAIPRSPGTPLVATPKGKSDVKGICLMISTAFRYMVHVFCHCLRKKKKKKKKKKCAYVWAACFCGKMCWRQNIKSGIVDNFWAKGDSFWPSLGNSFIFLCHG